MYKKNVADMMMAQFPPQAPQIYEDSYGSGFDGNECGTNGMGLPNSGSVTISCPAPHAVSFTAADLKLDT